jgi:DNA modification methylase
MSYRILQGDALTLLRSLKPASVQTCVTSPPYWGLRDYGIPGTVWGGDPHHSHEWGDTIERHATNHTDKRRWNHARNGRGEEQPIEKRPGGKRQHIKQGSFCTCGAWFGALGLEPSVDLYVAHVVELFREVRRVLKNDATLWLNLGDSYNAQKGQRKASDKAGAKQRSNAGAVALGSRHCDGLKPKDLCMIPFRVALALQADGWWVRSDIVWAKTNPMPESVTDRPTKAHEYLFLLSKSQKYFYDTDAIKEPCSPDTHARYARGRGDQHKWADGGPGNQTIATNKPGSLFAPIGREGRNSRMHVDRDPAHLRYGSGNKQRKYADGTERNIPWTPGVNPKAAMSAPGSKQNASFSAAVKDVVATRNKRTVWTVSTKPFKGAHFATFPPKLIEPCILAGSRVGDIVLDPFNGAGTTGLVALEHGRTYLGLELNGDYIEMSHKRLAIPVKRKTKAA